MQELTRRETWEGRSRWESTSERSRRSCRGIWRRHAGKGDQTQHGKPQRWLRLGSTGNSWETGRAVWGGGEARSTKEAG